MRSFGWRIRRSATAKVPWQNHPRAENYSSSLMSSLAGNAFSGTCILAVIFAVFVHLELKSSDERAASSRLDAQVRHLLRRASGDSDSVATGS